MNKNFFIENAYNILGLDSDASEKEILKRSREIENLLIIDEKPEYALDLFSIKDVRTKAKTKEATEKLTKPDKKIIETFYWFFIKDNIDEKSLEYAKNGNFSAALKILQEKIEKSPNNFSGIRNKAVLESLIFSSTIQKKYLEESLKSWKMILSSDKQWSDFKKIYRLNNPSTSDVIFDSFKNNAEKILSSFYEGVSQSEKSPEIYRAFSKLFSEHSDQFDKEVLDPLLNKLAELTTEIENYEVKYTIVSVSENDKKISPKSSKEINNFKAQSDCITDDICKLGEKIWQSSKVRVVRDKNAMALRRIAINISNNSHLLNHPGDKKTIDALIESAYDICSDNSITENKIKEDMKASIELGAKLKSIKTRNRKISLAMEDITAKIKNHNFNGAIAAIDEFMNQNELSQEDKLSLLKLRWDCIVHATNSYNYPGKNNLSSKNTNRPYSYPEKTNKNNSSFKTSKTNNKNNLFSKVVEIIGTIIGFILMIIWEIIKFIFKIIF